MLPRPPRQIARLVFLGDISAVANRNAPQIDPGVAAVLRSADLIIANCESPVVRRPSAMLRTKLGTHHAMDAAFLLGLLQTMGVTPERLVLSLANNHALDQGIDGFNETVETLTGLGIAIAGTARAGLVTTVEIGALALGLVGFTQWRNAHARDFAGRVTMLGDLNQRWDEMEHAPVHLLCALPHWDWEFRHFPRARTATIAQTLLDKGVRLVAGHHAHVLQPLEQVGDALVAYGLGDFLGTVGTRQNWAGRIGAMLVADISMDVETMGLIDSYDLVPFMRLRTGSCERLSMIADLPEPLRGKVEGRLIALYGEP